MSAMNESAGRGTHSQAGAEIAAPARKQITRAQDATTTAPAVTVNAVLSTAYGPTIRRRFWSYAVICPRGHGVHLHRAGPPRASGYVRTAPCGETYVVLARTVVGSLAGAA